MYSRTKIEKVLYAAFLVTWVLPILGVDFPQSGATEMLLEEMNNIADRSREIVTLPRTILITLHLSLLLAGLVLFFFSSATWSYLLGGSIFFHFIFLFSGGLFAISGQVMALQSLAYFIAGALVAPTLLRRRGSSAS